VALPTKLLLYRNLGDNFMFEWVDVGFNGNNPTDKLYRNVVGLITTMMAWPDVFVANYLMQANLLYMNNGDSTFEKITTGAIVTDVEVSVSGCLGLIMTTMVLSICSF
jgi:hypothetical protein